MSRERKVVGFDRKLELAWLDATAAQVAAGATADELHAYLWKMLDGQVSAGSSGFNSDRGKTITVLKRIWSLVPEQQKSFRDRALTVLQALPPDERISIHWSLTLVAYPFFCDVAEAVGRLLSLQGLVHVSEVRRRTAELWGDRVITRNGSQRIVRCFVAWGLLAEGGRRGEYLPAKRQVIADPSALALLLEATLFSEGKPEVEIGRLLRHPALFAFDLPNLARVARSSDRFLIHRGGVNFESIGLRNSG